MRWRGAALALLIAATLRPTSLAAEPPAPCPPASDELEVLHGLLSGGARCGAFVLTSNGMATSFSYGWLLHRREVEAPYRVRFTMRRLSADSDRPLELHLLGVIVLIKDEAYGFYSSEAAFAESGWQPLPGLRTHRELRVEARQDERGVHVWVNGQALESRRVAGAPTRGRIGLAFKGHRGYRSRMWFEGFDVESRAAAGQR